MKFGIFTDSHIDYIHDGLSRVEKFYGAVKKYEVDFCVQLGDFCSPYENKLEIKKSVLALVNSQQIRTYHVLGNHDMDNNSKSEVLEFVGQDRAYGSFDFGDVHFIYLDASYYRDGKNEISYNCGNYKSAADSDLPILPGAELEWLKKDLASAKYPSVIFSHQSLVESRAGIINAENFRNVIRSAQNGVLMCICGHEHVDRIEEKEGVIYYCLNSMSYYWAGSAYTHSPYGERIESEFPFLKYVFPYKEPIFAIVEITADEIKIIGAKTEIVGTKPAEVNFEKKGLVDPVESVIRDRIIKRKI